MMKNKSTLAKLLSEEDIFVVHKQMPTAYFNSKTRELGLPIWKDEDMTKDIYDLMVCHEIGHALWTPLDMLENAAIRKISHSFVNIIEDARIERKAKEKYPGATAVMRRGYVDLSKRDFFGTNEKGIDNFNLIDRINVFFKSVDAGIPFSDEEKVWVDKVAKTKTPDDVLDLAEELYAWMAENAPEEESDDEKTMTDPNGESGEGEEGETGAGDSPAGDAGDEEKSKEDLINEIKEAAKNGDTDSVAKGLDELDAMEKEGKKDGNDNTTGGSDGNDDRNNKDVDPSKDGSIEGGVNSTGKAGIPVMTEDAFGKGMDSLRDKNAADREYANIPKIDSTKYIVGYKKILNIANEHFAVEVGNDNQGGLYFNNTAKEVDTLKKDSKKTVSYMIKEFEMKKSADQYARAAVSKTGSLDMNRLHTYKFNDDIFKKVTTLPGATNHGLVLVVDWSGSMAENLKGTIAQLFNLIWFCRRAKIPFEVLAFSDAIRWIHNEETKTTFNDAKKQSFKSGDIELRDFNLLNFFSSNMSLSEEMNMMHVLWMMAARWSGYRDWTSGGYPYHVPRILDLGGTPLNDAIITMMDYVPKFKSNNGVQKVNTVFLTDGASNPISGVYDLEFNESTNTHNETSKSFARGYSRIETIITDPVTNKKFSMEGSDTTNLLLKILKNRVDGMNVVGFFLAGTGRSGRIDKRTLGWAIGKDAYSDEMKPILHKVNKEKFYAVTGDDTGYDEYYILAGGRSLTPENESLSDDLIGAGKGKLKSAFAKSQKAKITSRVLLNRFIKMVA